MCRCCRMLLAVLLAGCVGASSDDATDDIVDSGVFDGELLGILINPDSVIVSVGDEAQLEAVGLLADRTSRDLTHVVSWSSSDPSVVQVSNDLDAEGLLAAVSVGEAVVTAAAAGVESVDVAVRVTDAALRGLSVTPSPVAVQVGQQVKLKATAVYSDGTRADSSRQVRWITGDGAVAQLEPDGRLTGIAAGRTEVRVEWDGVTADPVPVEVLGQAAPDLVIGAVHGEAGPDDITLTIRVDNRGSVGASDFWVDAFVDPATTPGPGQIGNDFAGVDYLGPGASLVIGLHMLAEPGERSIVVLADTEDEVDESNESNNSFGTSVTVGGGPGGPNLAIGAFEYLADSEAIYYAVDVYNGGSEDVGEFYVDVFVHREDEPLVGDDGDAWLSVDELAAGDTVFVDFLVEEYCEYCWSWVFVDSYDYVEETDETDNIAGPYEVEAE